MDSMNIELPTYQGEVDSCHTAGEPQREVVPGDAGAVLLVVEVGGLVYRQQQPGGVEHEEGGDGGDEDHGEAAVFALLVSPPLPPELQSRPLPTN